MTGAFAYSLPVFLLVALCCYFAYRTGKGDGTAAEKQAEDIKDKDARIIEDRLRRDADFAKRVRRRFTR